jgi:hypothetical protein
MKKTIDLKDFKREFEVCGRDNQFSEKGSEALFNYLEDLENETYEEYELDVIALCCDFTEYESLEEYNKEHDELDSIDDIEDFTTVIRIDNESFIVRAF